MDVAQTRFILKIAPGSLCPTQQLWYATSLRRVESSLVKLQDCVNDKASKNIRENLLIPRRRRRPDVG